MPHSFAELVEQAASDGNGAPRAAGRLMSLLENEPQRVSELLQVAGERARQPRLTVGVTGAPGSGKSTLTDALVSEHRRRWPQRRVGVVAVDPSSPFTGGAVLGDRVRMMRHATDPNVYVRSLATRGQLGGLSLGVKAVVRVMGLIGCDLVLIETVGVGQSEVEVARVADQVMVVMAPGQGDSVQLLKAGLLEIGDLFVVNKADRSGADELMRALVSMWQLRKQDNANQSGDDGEGDAARDMPIMRVVATEGTGVGPLLDRLEAHADREDPEARRVRRDTAIREEMRSAILEEAARRFERELACDATLDEHVQALLDGRTNVQELTTRLLRRALADDAR
ncbi:MAG: methylmalonyl Co-A mutase-associated GTPase MeaB [Phycisphaeraceae bacterium]